MGSRNGRATWPVIITFVLACAAPAWAVDGVVEINQAMVQAGGVTPGDAPDFPVTLSHSGSYRLTGDVSSSSKAVAAIVVTAPRVTLDLNGFSISFCTDPRLCLLGEAPGIDATGQDDVRIRNGTVVGSGGSCIVAGERAIVEDMRVVSCGDDGVAVSDSSLVVAVIADGVVASGVQMGMNSIVKNSVLTRSGSGVSILGGVGLIENCVVSENQVAITGNTVANQFRGGYRGSVITRNAGFVEVQPIDTAANVQSLGGNICGSDTVCP